MQADNEPSHTRRRWIKRAVLAALAVSVAGYLLRDFILGTPVETAVVVRSDLIQTVVASGRVMTPRRVSVGAEITGRVARIPVQEGQAVKGGAVLIELDSSDERASIGQARAALAQAEAKLRQLREVTLPAAQQGLIQAQAHLTQANRQFERARELKTKGFVSASALDEAQHNLDVAQSQVRAAELQVQSNSPGGSDVALAQTTLEQAQASLMVNQARLEQTVIRAPVNGTLIGRSVEPGNVVQPGKELMVLAPEGETQIVVQVDEKNLAQLKTGQKALGSADAFPRERFAVELVYINPGIDASRGAVEVKLKVLAPPPYLLQDMTVSVEIEIARRLDTVVVPAEAVHNADNAQPWVLVVEGRRAARRPVTLGLRGDAKIEILTGVSPDELLILAANTVIAPGQRVRAVATKPASAP